jgi:hypothetical protein
MSFFSPRGRVSRVQLLARAFYSELMRCHCEQCRDEPLESYTEAYRHRCEAAWLKRQPRIFRADYLERIAVRRGLDAAIALRHTMAILPAPRGSASQ